jgi:gas vesicle protein
MFRLRTLLGAAIGGAAVYFFDPRSGAERRARLRSWWGQNQQPILDTARQTTSAAQESVSQLGEQASARVGDLKNRVQGSGSSSASSSPSPAGEVSGPYDTATAGTAGVREETGTGDLSTRFRGYEGQEDDRPPSGDLPATT